jgi:hypothetical protein
VDADQRWLADRRLRRRHQPDPGSIVARVRPGHHADIVNVSADGMQIDAACCLRPGTLVDLQIEMTAYRAQVRARVVHANVSELGADRVRYRGGLVFEREIERLSAFEAEESLDDIADRL